MRITFLGTGAAEGIPSPFCECSTCKRARSGEHLDVRKRTSLLINDDLLIDMGPDLVPACALFGISLSTLKYALITHSHFDHFYPNNIEIRSSRYLTSPLTNLTIIAGPSTMQLLDQIGYKDEALHITRVPCLPFQSEVLGSYVVKSIAATHASGIGDAMNYIIEDGVRRILYATDTGIYRSHVWSHFQGRQFDLVILDATNGLGPTSKNHLNFLGMQEMIGLLRRCSAITDATRVYATHFSHHGHPPHGELESVLGNLGVYCSYDGLIVDI